MKKPAPANPNLALLRYLELLNQAGEKFPGENRRREKCEWINAQLKGEAND